MQYEKSNWLKKSTKSNLNRVSNSWFLLYLLATYFFTSMRFGSAPVNIYFLAAASFIVLAVALFNYTKNKKIK